MDELMKLLLASLLKQKQWYETLPELDLLATDLYEAKNWIEMSTPMWQVERVF